MQTIERNGLCILVAEPGGVITENFPTVYRSFLSSVVVPSEADAAKWRDMTATEQRNWRNTEEGKYANSGQKPTEEMIEAWRHAFTPINTRGRLNPGVSYGRWNPDTGYFETDDLKNITVNEARSILSFENWSNTVSGKSEPLYVRTVPLVQLNPRGGNVEFKSKLWVVEIEAIRFLPHNGFLSLSQAFFNCVRLKYIRSLCLKPGCAKDALYMTFEKCQALVECELKNLNISVSFAHSPLLSQTSVRYLVENALTIPETMTPATITLHPDVFANVPPDAINLAISKNYIITTPTT